MRKIKRLTEDEDVDAAEISIVGGKKNALRREFSGTMLIGSPSEDRLPDK